MGPLQHGLDAAGDDLLHVRGIHVVLLHQGQHVLDVGQARERILGRGLGPGFGSGLGLRALLEHRQGERGHEGKRQH